MLQPHSSLRDISHVGDIDGFVAHEVDGEAVSAKAEVLELAVFVRIYRGQCCIKDRQASNVGFGRISESHCPLTDGVDTDEPIAGIPALTQEPVEAMLLQVHRKPPECIHCHSEVLCHLGDGAIRKLQVIVTRDLQHGIIFGNHLHPKTTCINRVAGQGIISLLQEMSCLSNLHSISRSLFGVIWFHTL